MNMVNNWIKAEKVSDYKNPHDCTKHFPLVSTVADNLFGKVLYQLNKNFLYDERIMLLGFDLSVRSQLREVLARIDVVRFAFGEAVTFLSSTSVENAEISTIIVDLDVMDNIVDAVDMLRTFRTRHPGICVVLVSSEVSGDDFSRERAPICDATLRAPISKQRMKDALLTAIEARHSR